MKQTDNHTTDQEQTPLKLVTAKQHRKSYTIREKLQIINDHKEYGFQFISTVYGVEQSLVCKWERSRPALEEWAKKTPSAKKLHPGGTTKLSDYWENWIVQQINEIRATQIPVTYPVIKILGLQAKEKSEVEGFKASYGWIQRFTKRHNLTLRQATKKCPTVKDDMLFKLIQFQRDLYQQIHLNKIDCLVNIDETAVNNAMPTKKSFSPRGNKEVLITSSNQEKKRVTCVLGVIKPLKSNLPEVSKTKPMIIFKGKTSRCVAGVPLDEQAIITWNENAWNTTTTCVQYLNEFLDPQLRNYRLLIVWDNFSVHTSPDVLNTIKEKGWYYGMLPPNATSLIQPLDVVVNKPFKDRVRALYNNKLVEGGVTLKVSHAQLYEWVVTAWSQIVPELCHKSFHVCGLGVAPFPDSDECKTIYWRKLKSLQDEITHSELPSIHKLFPYLFS